MSAIIQLSWLSLLVFIGYYNCQSNLVVKKLGKFLVTSDFTTEVLLNVRKKEEKQNKNVLTKIIGNTVNPLYGMPGRVFDALHLGCIFK